MCSPFFPSPLCTLHFGIFVSRIISSTLPCFHSPSFPLPLLVSHLDSLLNLTRSPFLLPSVPCSLHLPFPSLFPYSFLPLHSLLPFPVFTFLLRTLNHHSFTPVLLFASPPFLRPVFHHFFNYCLFLSSSFFDFLFFSCCSSPFFIVCLFSHVILCRSTLISS